MSTNSGNESYSPEPTTDWDTWFDDPCDHIDVPVWMDCINLEIDKKTVDTGQSPMVYFTTE